MSWENIPGWFGFRETYDLMVADAKDGDTIVEVGVAFGRSAAYLARQVIDSGKRIEVVCIDPWVDDWWMPPNDYPLDAPRPTWGGEYAEQARALGGPRAAFEHYMALEALEERKRLLVVQGYSREASILFEPRSIAGVMIDGNHNYAQVVDDIKVWRGLVRPGGWLAGDDYSTDFPGVMQAVFDSGLAVEVVGTTWRVRL